MFIQTEQTPNPATLKFLPGQDVLGDRTANFPDAESAKISPLAGALFEISGVIGVFFGRDFISVTRDETPWTELKAPILGAIMQHLTAGAPLLPGLVAAGAGEEDNEIVATIKELLETRVRPAVAQDGGDIIYRDFRDGIVYLHMQGSCSGCPSSTATLKYGIENMLKHYVPEVTAVEAV